ncbi:MAG: tyrosine-type recombinase/integrase [Spirochaetia bacterium]|nr:tyrosine-type recombinase/integrase [Spirochaetia bacterium]
MDYITQMILDMKFAAFSDRTIQSYSKSVRLAIKQIEKHPADIDQKDINEFLLYLYEKDAAGKTMIVYYSALKFFFSKTLKRNWKFDRIPKLGNYNRKQPRPLTRNEVKILIKNASKTIYRVIFALMYSGGLRLSEARFLTLRDINEKEMIINIEKGKGGFRRQTVLAKKALEMLKEYQEVNPTRGLLFPTKRYDCHSGLLFGIPEKGKPISQRSVIREFRKICEKTGIPGITSSHSLRHSFATHLIEDGLSIISVQKLLGHKYLKTTLQYLKYAEMRPEKNFSPYDMF